MGEMMKGLPLNRRSAGHTQPSTVRVYAQSDTLAKPMLRELNEEVIPCLACSGGGGLCPLTINRPT
jgi:hypothetical protein